MVCNIVKIPINCKFGNWKISESKQVDNVFIPSSVFNINDGCFTILILNLGENHFKLKPGSRIGVVMDIFYIDFCDEPPCTSSTGISVTLIHTRDVATQVNFDDIKMNSIKISALQIISDIKEQMLNNSYNCFPASEHSEFSSVANTMPEYLRDLLSDLRKNEPCSSLRCRICIDWIRSYFFQKMNSISFFFKLIKHHMKLFDYASRKFELRPTLFHFRDEEQKCIQDMLDAGVIQPSCSDWASPVCLVRKRCGDVRVTSD